MRNLEDFEIIKTMTHVNDIEIDEIFSTQEINKIFTNFPSSCTHLRVRGSLSYGSISYPSLIRVPNSVTHLFVDQRWFNILTKYSTSLTHIFFWKDNRNTICQASCECFGPNVKEIHFLPQHTNLFHIRESFEFLSFNNQFNKGVYCCFGSKLHTIINHSPHFKREFFIKTALFNSI